ncbi:hypothetical protein [Bacillus tianshenii]|nr:hypothetical protein [Bacillus tianshenii]
MNPSIMKNSIKSLWLLPGWFIGWFILNLLEMPYTLVNLFFIAMFGFLVSEIIQLVIFMMNNK